MPSLGGGSLLKAQCTKPKLKRIKKINFLPAANDESAEIELTYNWDGDNLGKGSRNFGHLAYRVKNIYETCQKLKDMGVTINRPPRDGHMAFVRSPDNISIEILQEGHLEPKEPWSSMQNTGEW